MNGILAATLMVGGTGLLIGILLGIAGKKFYVEVDERETKVREALPGNNCGGCGYPGCDGAAAAVVKGEAPISVCPVAERRLRQRSVPLWDRKPEHRSAEKQWYGAPVRVTWQRTSMNTRVQGTAPTPVLYRAAVRRAAETDVLVLETA